MGKTITAVFDKRGQAEYVRKELILAGFEKDALTIINPDISDEIGSPVTNSANKYTIADDAVNFFRCIFCSSENEEQQANWEAARRGMDVFVNSD